MVYEEFGSPELLQIKEVEKPIPKDDELLVKVHATSVNAIDIIFRTGEKKLYGLTKLMTGFKKPKAKILGFDVSGEVESVGEKVTKFKKGDLIYGAKGPLPGANAEYCCISEKSVAFKPSNMSHEEAAAVPDTGCTALTGLKEKVNIKEGQRVLIYGASGGVGTFAVQIAKLFTSDVTAVCSTDKVSNAHLLGASEVIDYTKEDFTQNGQVYDVIFDAVGRRKISYAKCKNSLSEDGKFVTVDLETVLFKQIRNKRIKSYMTKVKTENLNFLREQIEAGKIKSLVEKVFPLSQLADAHRCYEKGHLKGKIVIKISERMN
ncbi:MAG: NAD(P)-dependent alcohol dehydrogenase [Candidatus Hodarchaeota archaeon]